VQLADVFDQNVFGKLGLDNRFPKAILKTCTPFQSPLLNQVDDQPLPCRTRIAEQQTSTNGAQHH